MRGPIPGRLPAPSGEFGSIELPIIELRQSWYRSHPVSRSPVYYGRKRRYRFDSPDSEYGVLYVAEDPFGAFAETYGQFLTASPQARSLTTEELAVKALSEMVCERPLKLVDLTGRGLARIGADSRLFAGDYRDSQVWSKALHGHPAKVDGLFYPARHDPKRTAAAIYDESLTWTTLFRKSWLGAAFTLRDVLNEYGFGLIESRIVEPAAKKGPKQEVLRF